MNDQFDLFDENPERLSKLKRKFLEYHKNNPEVYTLFKEYAFKMINKGKKSYGARTICELIRWHHDVNSDRDAEDFKISNNHVPFYARLFMKDFPAHKGFFRTQEGQDK